ncbi:MAG: LysM peptidoglycan-binding domain-containing protein [Cyanobacteria bacterium]|nr:LysM peptidoglycan-binding domain-containing protein [Cyanobacteriota bacterium]
MNRETFAHMQEMINQRRQLMNELKAGARSGVTGDFGRQEFFDSQDSMQHKTDNPSQTEASFDASFKVTPSTGEKPAWDSKSLSNLDGNTDIGPKIKSGLYEVRTGDSLTKIAKDSLSNKNPSSQEVLDRVMLIAKENNISNIKAINAGDKIRIPLDLKKLDPEFEESKVQLKGSVRKTELIHHDKAPGSIGKPAQDSHHNPTKSPAKKPHLHDGKQPAEAKSHLHDGKQPAESKPHEVRPGYKPPDLEKLQVRKEVLDQMDMLEIQSKILFDSYNFLKDVRDLGVHSGAISKMRSEEMRKAAEQSSLACSLKFVVTLGKTMNVLSEDAKKDLEKVIHQLETSDAKAFEQLAKLGEKGGKHVEDELSKLGEKESDNPIFKTLDKLLTPLPSASPETKALMESLKENFHQLIGGSYEEMKNGVASVIAEILVNNRRQKKSH